MAVVIGVDEAGYGPNLGPLVIGFSVWQVPALEANLYELLKGTVSIAPRADQLAICDSKKLGDGIGGLETTVFAGLAAMQQKLPSTWNDLGRMRIPLPKALPKESAEQASLAWFDEHSGFDDDAGDADEGDADVWNCEDVPLRLPVECNLEEVTRMGGQLRMAADAKDAGLIGMGVVLIHPGQFNRMLERHGNKSRLLGAATMHLARHALGLVPAPEQVRVLCDRQGGRMRYGRLLRATFDSHEVARISESPECSEYRLVQDPAKTSGTPADFQIGFQVRGESHLPVALASMCAKYFRELAMIQWNRYWRTRIDGIRPTAGYPVDAVRFRKDLRRHVAESEMPDQLFWRAK